MQSLGRKVAMRRGADQTAATAQATRAIGRTGQVARTTVLVGDTDMFVDEMLSSAAETSETVEYQEGELDGSRLVTDGVIDSLPGMSEESWSAEDIGQIAADGADWAAEVADLAQAKAAQAADDALAAAQGSAAAVQAAADAKAAAEAAQGDAAQAILDAESKSEAARVAAEAYAKAAAEAAEAAAVAEASGDATAKAEAARAAAELAAAEDAKTKADAAEAAAKAAAAAAQETANQAAAAAGDAQSTAEAARFLTEGLYQVIPSVAEPETSPTGALKAGDQWWVIGTGELAGKFVGVQVYTGSAWEKRQLVGNSVLVPGSVGDVLIEDGGISAEKMAASFYYGREFYGGLFEQQGQSSPVGVYSLPVTESSRFQWMAYEGVGSGSSYAVTPPVYSFSDGEVPAPPAAVSAAGNTSYVGGVRHTSSTNNDLNTRWMVPDEFDGATADVSFYVFTRVAGRVSIVGGTEKSIPANVWTKIDAKGMSLSAGGLISFEVVTALASRPLFITAPEIHVRVPGEIRARLSTEGNVSGLRFARGETVVGKYTGSQAELVQTGGGVRRVLVTPNGVSFSDRNSDGTVNPSRFKTIKSDGSLLLAAPRVVLHGDVSFASVPKFPGDYDRVGLPGTIEPGFTVFSSEVLVRAGMVTLSLNIQGPIAQGAGLTVWKNFRAAWRPTVNQQAAAWLDGGYAGVAWLRPDGTIAVANRSGATRNSAQFTISYPLPEPPTTTT